MNLKLEGQKQRGGKSWCKLIGKKQMNKWTIDDIGDIVCRVKIKGQFNKYGERENKLLTANGFSWKEKRKREK